MIKQLEVKPFITDRISDSQTEILLMLARNLGQPVSDEDLNRTYHSKSVNRRGSTSSHLARIREVLDPRFEIEMVKDGYCLRKITTSDN